MSNPTEPVAIIGMAGRFPGAQDVDEFWAALRDGRSGLRTLSDEDLLAAGVPESEFGDPRYVRVNGDAPDVDRFDSGFFRMTPREARVCDPQLRIFLETAHAAVENAGYDPTAITDVGVYAGVGHSLYWDHNLRFDVTSVGDRDLAASILNYPDYIATLVSYKLNFTGPSMTVLTACSSSLLTLHLAVSALQNGECRMALAGGSDIEVLGQGYSWTAGGPFSKDGRCRSFDAGANGTVFSSGVGVVAVKRLSDALADGDRVRAVVRATAAGNDGSDKVGFSAPSVSGQTAVVMEALSLAGVGPADIDYVEAHGTGTPLGDPIEFAALSAAFRGLADADLPVGYCGLGSVKSNVGHLGHAAGVASLIKTVLCLERELLAPTLHVTEPNPELEWAGSPFGLVTRSRPWTRGDRPRIAGINSLGFGGTNVHAVVEEAPLPAPVPVAPPRPRLVVWSARTDAAERAYRSALADHLATADPASFADAAATLQSGRTAHDVRGAVVADDAADARAALVDTARIIGGGGRGRVAKRPVLFLFPGQGSQHAGMARGLYRTEPTFTAVLDDCLELLAAAGADVRSALLTGTDTDLEATDVAQPALFAVEYALARMWESWGVAPDAVLGHSVGELVAATVAGVFTPADGARLVVERGRSMAAMPAGSMLAVRGSVDQLGPLLPGGVVVAALNGPRQTVLSGAADAVAAAEEVLRDAGLAAVRVRTSHAFHSPLMADAAARFAAAFDGITAQAPSATIVSAAAGAEVGLAELRRPDFWSGQLITPVRFADALDVAAARGDVLALEVGPERVLTGSAGARMQAVASLPGRGSDPERDPHADLRAVLTAAGTLWTAGHPLDWAAVRGGEPLRRVPLPGYRFERERHWVDPAPRAAEVAAVAGAAPEAGADTGPADEAEPVAASPLSVPAWVELPPAPPGGPGRDVSTVALLPADDAAARPLVLALQQAGLRIVPVRPGSAYHDGGAVFRIRPGHAADLERLLRNLAERGRPARLLVHAWTVGDWDRPASATLDEQLDLSCRSLVDLVQWGARAAGAGAAPDLLVLTSRSADVSGGEQLDPVKATLHGLVRTLTQEVPEQRCRLVDVGPGVAEDELVAELRAATAEPVVALRRNRRWVRTERPADAPAGAGAPLRRDGVYLITGGLGALGLEVARAVARSGMCPRLVLVGRTDPTAAGADPARSAEVGAVVAELEAMGAQVRIHAADVADRRSMARVVDTTAARHGPVNGVFHLAGVAGDGMVLFRDPAAVTEVLRPKVHGMVVLEEVFGDRPQLDFLVSFSSRAGLDGLVGSGDYAAANAFLDAHAAVSDLARGRVTSVNWPSWARVGMAARAADAPKPGALRVETVLVPDEEPFLDEHRVGGVPVLPGTGVLDLLVRSFDEATARERTASVRLTDVLMREPLACREARTVVVDFEPRPEGWSFTVRSAPVAGGTAVLHVTGDIEGVDDPAPAVDLGALLDRMPDRRPAPSASGPNRMFVLGPRWRSAVAESFAEGDEHGDEKTVEIRLPELFLADLDRHPLHPALLDVALSSARDSRRDGLFLPFLYRSLTVYGPLPRAVHAHVQRRAAADGLLVADVTVVDPGGRVVLRCDGFTMRAVQRGFLDGPGSASAAEPAGSGSRIEPRPLPTGGGIDPEVGARLTLDLLASRPARHVAVRPFRDGRPVPLPAAPHAAHAAVPAPAPAPSAPADPGPRPAAEQAGIPAPRPATEAGPPTPAAAAVPASDADPVDRVRRLWTAVLGTAQIAADDNFFELGGNSLAAIDLVGMMRKEFGIELNVAMLFDYPTLGALAEALATDGVLLSGPTA